MQQKQEPFDLAGISTPKYLVYNRVLDDLEVVSAVLDLVCLERPGSIVWRMRTTCLPCFARRIIGLGFKHHVNEETLHLYLRSRQSNLLRAVPILD